MSEIPKDVMAAAMRALMVPEHEMVESVSRAIMAERERLWRELGDIVMVECARAQMTHPASTSLRNAIVARAVRNAQP